MRIFKKKKTARPRAIYLAALDIGTDTVKALVFKVDKEQAIIRGSAEMRHPLGNIYHGQITDLDGVITTVQETLHQATSQARVTPQNITIGLAGELVRGRTISIKHRRERPERAVSMDELRGVINNVQSKVFKEIRSELAYETGIPELDVKLVDSMVVGVNIDGQKMLNPLGFSGKKMEVSIFNSFAPLVQLSSHQTVGEATGYPILSISSESYALARALEPDLSAILIDVGGDRTTISIIRHGQLDGSHSFGIGGRTFTKRLTEQLKVSLAQAEKIKLNYSRDQLDKKSSTTVAEAIKSDLSVWLSGVELILAELTVVDQLPPQILLSGQGALLPDINRVLGGKVWIKKLPFPTPPAIQLLNPTQVKRVSFDSQSHQLDQQHLTVLALAALATELSGEENLVSTLMRKAITMLKN